MIITRLAVDGLNGKTSCDLRFHPDLNVITGKNGSGKTSLLKLMWYMISGNLERIPVELTFSSARIETDTLTLAITQLERKAQPSFRLEWTVGSKSSSLELPHPDTDASGYNKANVTIHTAARASVFFPTFRRIEGGFSIEAAPQSRERAPYIPHLRVQSALSDLSHTISVRRHRFVASISTTDIIDLLTTHYADVSESTNNIHRGLAADITSRIHDYYLAVAKPDRERLDDANTVLDAIKAAVDSASESTAAQLRPFDTLSRLITTIFRHKGIRVTELVTLGDAKNAIASDKLSAGEKQMLSFLCYNAFYRNTPFFIDEPELSLHVDWQRLLFPTLLDQSTSNQFIVATHSPFIYSQYSDRELFLDEDRGAE